MRTMKKLLATLLAMMMVLSMFGAALAAENDLYGEYTKEDMLDDLSGLGSGSTGAPIEIEVGGEVVYLDTEVYSVVLPSEAAYKFVVDPQGLLAVTEEQSVALEDLEGGQIVGSAPVAFINNSAVPILLSAKISGTTSATDVTFADKDTDFSDDLSATNTALLWAAVSTTDVVARFADDAEDPTAGTGVLTAENGYPLSTTATEFKFALPAAPYEVSLKDGAYELTRTDMGVGNAFYIGGQINTDGDWSDFETTKDADGNVVAGTKSIGLKIVFDFAKDTATHADADYLGAAPGKAYLLKDDTRDATVVDIKTGDVPAAIVQDVVSPAAPAEPAGPAGFDAASYVIVSNVAKTVNFDFGGETIKSVTSNGNALATSGQNMYSHNLTAGTMTFTFSNAAILKTVIVTLSDDSTHTATFAGA